jgi:hypothetical protein
VGILSALRGVRAFRDAPRTNEGTAILVGNPKKAEVVATPITPSSASQLFRAGDFKLDEEGALAGKVLLRYTGHKARDMRNILCGLTQSEKEDKVKETLRGLVINAEISDILIANQEDAEKPLEIKATLSVAAYADLSGSRLFLQPAVFDKNANPIFKKEKRAVGIRFPYALETHDNVRITFPDSFEVEEGYAPQSVVNTTEISHAVQLGQSKSHPILVYRKDLRMSLRNLPATAYDSVREIFNAIDAEDHHVLTLRRKDASGTPAGGAPQTPAANEGASKNP